MSSYGVWLSAAGMKVNDHRQTVLTNNLANAHTTGFKQDLAVIRERPVERVEDGHGLRLAHPVLDSLAGGVNVRQSYHDFSQGAIEQTRQPLDLAIIGNGMFVVDDGSNQRFTRDGTFTVNVDRELVLTAGEGKWRVLDDADNVIRLDPDLPDPRVSEDGTVRQGAELIGRIKMVSVEDKQALRKTGENLFTAPDGAAESIPAQVQPGALESSNFNVMTGLASMIEASRAYETNANLLRLQDDMTGRLVSNVGRLN